MGQRHPPTEIELTLRVAPDAVRRLAANRLLRGNRAPVRRRLHGIYYDTPALDLLRKGIALRVRKEGGAWVQTVKGSGSVHAGLHERPESEARVAGPRPDLSRVKGKAFAGALRPSRIRDALRPVFVTEFERSRRLLQLETGTIVEASIDRGVIRSGLRAEPLAELELELKKGDRAQLYQLALRLQEEVPLVLESRSKAARGYALRGASRETPVKARAAVLDSRMRVADAFKAVTRASLAQLHANERGMLKGADPEFLHQMRVALRRLRSALGVFSPPIPGTEVEPLARELKWAASRLGPARDWDVFVTETLPAIEAEPGAHGKLQAFSERCGALRRRANASARRTVRSPRYQRLLLRLGAWIEAEGWYGSGPAPERDALREPVTEFAARILEKRCQQARKRGRRLAERSPGELHRLRIAIKKLRYAGDFFSSLYAGRASRNALRHLGRLQDILGAMNDAAALGGVMAQCIGRGRGRHALEARGTLAAWSRRRSATLKGELKAAWKAFRAGPRFW